MLKGLDVLNFAVEIEKNGEKFYKMLEKLVVNAKAKELFKGLAEAEAQHVIDFEKLKEKVSDYQTPESYDGEYMEYVEILIASHIFHKHTDINALSLQVIDARSALDLALVFEKDSIVFFSELGNLLSSHDQQAVKDLIKEEHKHIRALGEMRREY